MSNKQKVLLTRIIYGLLVVLVIGLSVFIVSLSRKVNLQNKEIADLKRLNASLEDDYVKNIATITIVDLEGKEKSYFVDKNLNISVYSFLISKDYTSDDFTTLDGIDYFYKNGMTDILELKENQDYYLTDEWGSFLYVGLQAIIIDQDLTVVFSPFPS